MYFTEFLKCNILIYLGKLFDKTGAIRNWWSTASEENFQEKEKCIIDQYNGYVVPEIGENVRSLKVAIFTKAKTWFCTEKLCSLNYYNGSGSIK